MKILLKNGQVNNKVQNILIKDDIIDYIGTNIPDFDIEYDLQNLIAIPGMIDPHVHVRDLQQANKEDWTSVSAAALRGGVTTIFDMPNNKPPTINLHNLNLKREKAKISQVNYKFNIAVTNDNLKEVEEILNFNSKDISALKLFLAGSNSNEYVSDKEKIMQIFDLSYKFNIPVICHTEIQKCIDENEKKFSDPTIKNHSEIRNRECSIKGTELLIEIAKETGGIFYSAHTSTKEEIELINDNRNECRVCCELSPHHLLLNEDVLDSVGNFGKVNPPLRTKEDNDAFLKAINNGIVDTIGSDHAPHLVSEKLQDYKNAPSGFPSIEIQVPLLLNEVNKGNLSLEKLIEITSLNTSKIFNLKNRGEVKEGNFADITVVDMNKTWKIESQKFKTKAKYSPYEGMGGRGDVVMTFVNGELKYTCI